MRFNKIKIEKVYNGFVYKKGTKLHLVIKTSNIDNFRQYNSIEIGKMGFSFTMNKMVKIEYI